MVQGPLLLGEAGGERRGEWQVGRGSEVVGRRGTGIELQRELRVVGFFERGRQRTGIVDDPGEELRPLGPIRYRGNAI
jgi:hypothetical protein